MASIAASPTSPPSTRIDDNARFRIDPASVLGDDLDGEIVLLHLGSGNYYSLAGTGAEVWRMVGCDFGLGAIVAAFAAPPAGGAEAVRRSVVSFVEELLAEGLLEVATSIAPAEPRADEPELPFEAPVLSKYTDMQDLLLLDPIHEVDAGGWPARGDGDSDA